MLSDDEDEAELMAAMSSGAQRPPAPAATAPFRPRIDTRVSDDDAEDEDIGAGAVTDIIGSGVSVAGHITGGILQAVRFILRRLRLLKAIPVAPVNPLDWSPEVIIVENKYRVPIQVLIWQLTSLDSKPTGSPHRVIQLAPRQRTSFVLYEAAAVTVVKLGWIPRIIVRQRKVGPGGHI
jgi:hypothetical protein